MLDSKEAVKAVDLKDMLGTIEQMPKHLAEGLRVGRASGPPKFSPSNVVVCGMGGSAIGGDFLKILMEQAGCVACSVQRDYVLLPSVGRNSLVLIASYSGNTEETISMLEEARRRRAKLVGISSGGKVAELCRRAEIQHARVPSGLVPRASLGYMLGTMIGVLQRAGVYDPGEGFKEALKVLGATISVCRQTAKTAENPAKKLAHELYCGVPVVIGYGLSAVVARRWANQFNENGKSMAFWSELPEMDHNEIVGWVQDPRSRGFMPVTLEHGPVDRMMARRLEATKAMLSKRSPVSVVQAHGSSPLSKMLSLTVVGDFASAYLGILKNEDPSSTEPIEHLKEIIAKK